MAFIHAWLTNDSKELIHKVPSSGKHENSCLNKIFLLIRAQSLVLLMLSAPQCEAACYFVSNPEACNEQVYRCTPYMNHPSYVPHSRGREIYNPKNNEEQDFQLLFSFFLFTGNAQYIETYLPVTAHAQSLNKA